MEKILQQSNTLVITPPRVYDLNDEDQELITDIEGVFARYEYRMIKKRFQRDRKIGARLGHWTNGPAPFPYAYDSDARSLQIDPARKLDRRRECTPCGQNTVGACRNRHLTRKSPDSAQACSARHVLALRSVKLDPVWCDRMYLNESTDHRPI